MQQHFISKSVLIFKKISFFIEKKLIGMLTVKLCNPITR